MTLKSGVGSVQFYPDKPLLETELNELQSVQNEAREDIIRDSIPSGFTQLGELDFDYMLNNENKVKLKSDSVAFVNGMRIFIPAGTIIDIGKAPEKESREDLLFLEVWKEEVGADGTLTQYGGEGQASITNHMKDERVGSETAKRIINRWRIRHVADVDFIAHGEDGLERISAEYKKGFIHAQGGLNAPVFPDTICNWTTEFHIQSDKGLYATSKANADLKALDNIVYAIPMFRLYRKPSCGKSIPFEYDKINPKVDYSKFAKLVKDEKVERVHSENIKGRSLVNLITRETNFFLDVADTVDEETTTRSYVCEGTIKPNTTYTIIRKIRNSRFVIGETSANVISKGINCKRIYGLNANAYTTDFMTKITTGADTKSLIVYLDNTSARAIDTLVLEGDWTDKEIPEYFTGLKSLGEDEGNLVTVKNGVLNDNTYDPCDGNQKLNTFPNVTHVMCENTIIPEFTAELKKNGAKQSDVTSFGKLTTEGTEQVEFTKIKGRTLQNLIKNTSWNVINDGKMAYMEVDWSLLKPSTKYTYIVYCPSSKVNLNDGYIGTKFTTVSALNISKPVLVTTVDDLVGATGIFNPHLYASGSNQLVSSDFTNTKIMLIEGDYTNVPIKDIPFIEGIKSIGESDNEVKLKTVGKNFINPNNILQGGLTWFSGQYHASSTDRTCYNEFIPVKENDIVYRNLKSVIFLYDLNKNYIGAGRLGNFNATNYKTSPYTVEHGVYFIKLVFGGNNGTTPQELMTKNPYLSLIDGDFEPYKGCKQEIYLKEPLRSLPNGVCDEIVGNKVIRRVGKVVFNGSESWEDGLELTNSKIFYCRYSATHKSGVANILSSHFPSQLCYSEDREGIYVTGSSTGSIAIRINKVRLSSNNSVGLKAWLSENPVTVYYELVNPVEEYLEHVYEKESIKTYQLDAPLRSLPNGVKDEIKDGVLIRRCAEIILNGSENWRVDPNPTDSTIAFKNLDVISNISPVLSSANNLMSDKFGVDFQMFSGSSEAISVYKEKMIAIRLLKSKLTSQDADGFKAWLKANPVKVIYQLATPTETILTEAKPQNANFSLQRQFGEGNWLRELPNGVKDTVENGKVIRRTKKVTINGTEANYNIWGTPEDGDLTYNVYINTETDSILGTTENLLCDKFTSTVDGFVSKTKETVIISNKKIHVSVLKTRLSTVGLTGIKEWLTKNPITILYELATSTEEALSTDNYMPYPCHEINTYCGSMYVGQGRNHVVNENKMPSEDVVIIDTPFRSIESKSHVEDCRYKKDPNGYIPVLTSLTANKFTGNFIIGNVNGDGTFGTNPKVCMNDTHIKVKPNTKYTIKFRSSLGSKFTKYVNYFNGTGTYMQSGSYGVTNNVEITTPQGCHFIRLQGNTNPTRDVVPSELTELSNTVSIFESTEATDSIIEYKYGETVIENTELNDIEDLRHLTSLVGFNYDKILNESFDLLLRGQL